MSDAERKTKETAISLSVEFEPGDVAIEMPCGFLRHMLELLCHHAGWKMRCHADGDVDVDAHHITEDVGIVLGKAIKEEASKQYRNRYGWCAMPMDGTLVIVAVDLSGRGSLTWNAPFTSPSCGGYDLELLEEFWKAVTREAQFSLHVHTLVVDNSHHLAEAIFKGIGRALRQALTVTDAMPSSKGVWI